LLFPVIAGGVAALFIIVVGTFLVGKKASSDTEKAVRAVSFLYLDELAGRREQVVATALKNNIDKIYVATSLMDSSDLSGEERLRAYQARMKKLYGLEKFAFVDEDGLIYTSLGTQRNIGEYNFDHIALTKPEISVKDVKSGDKKVIIAIPVDMSLNGKKLMVCFMEIGMANMLQGVSLQSDNNDTTFCNIYTRRGEALTNMVLGGLASEDNLLEAMKKADFKGNYSIEKFLGEFSSGKKGAVAFGYGGIEETLSYVPIQGTDWMLTYLIRDSVISEEISSVSKEMLTRSLVLTVIVFFVFLAMFAVIVVQIKKNAALEVEKEKDNMINALSSDYRSVYYVDLDKDEGVCYRKDKFLKGSVDEGQTFPFTKNFTKYANAYISEDKRDEFLKFVSKENIKAALKKEAVISYRFMTRRGGVDRYGMVKMAGVKRNEDDHDRDIHKVGIGFVDIDAEMRDSLQKNQALSDALAAAEDANKAKTVFLSNMSHEIRTPMNAIIGLDNIALNDPDISEKTRDYLEKIGVSAKHLLNLINDILDMSRIESGSMALNNEEFSFPKFIESINTLFIGQCSEKQLNYSCHINGTLDDYYIGDNTKLRQILINTLSNAVKFTPTGGEVNLGVERVARFAGKSTIRFTVRDTGIGMSEEFLPKIFDTFAQEKQAGGNKYGSSGLGMAIVKNLVDMMNGDISVKSKKGEGTEITVTITLLDSEKNDSVKKMGEVDFKGMTALVVDDDAIACENAKISLGNLGLLCETALSGEQAIEMVKIRHARREPYNLILIDWKMPEMDGVETTRRIRSIVGSESAIIILTAYNWDDITDEARAAGVDSFLAKPLFASNVVEEFRYAIGKKKAANAEEAKADLKGKRILLAEDMEVNAEIMVMVLNMREMQVECATNGREALEMFSKSGENYYDAILMDMNMPEMDGLEATMKIRSLDRNDAKTVPIIALTAKAFDEDVQRSLQAGLNAHLSKPVEPDALFATLESMIR
jgi:signal transduction histidine kinase/DNA-binding response OmpR family regulator